MAKTKKPVRRALNRVPMAVATNPVARAIERAAVQRAAERMESMILIAQDRSPQAQLIDDCIETIGLAMLSSCKSWDLERDAQSVLCDAMDALTRMGLDQQRWHAERAGLVADAVAISAPVLLAISPRDRAEGARELAGLNRLARDRAVAAQEAQR